MARLTVVTFGVFSIVFILSLFHPADGILFNSGRDYVSPAKTDVVWDTGAMIISRQKRGITDSMTHMMFNIIEAPFHVIGDIIRLPFRIIYRIFEGPINLMKSILMTPIRIVQEIFRVISLPFRYSFRAITFPLRFFIARYHHRSLRNTSTDGQSPSVTTDNSTNIPEQGISQSLSASIRRIAIKALWFAWTIAKTHILPALDKVVEKIQYSNFIPDDLKRILQRMHSMYEMLQLFRIL